MQDLINGLIDVRNSLIDDVIIENNIDDDYIYDYSEYDERIKILNDAIEVLKNL